MGWDDVGIEDPGLKWSGPYQDWNNNKWGALFEDTTDEIESIYDDLDGIYELGFFDDIIEKFEIWLEHIEFILFEAKSAIKFREELLAARVELLRLRKEFDAFAIEINWY